MGVRLVKEKHRDGIPAYRMADGDLGVVVESHLSGNIGRVVQRYDNTLISVGMPSGRSFSRVIPDEDEDFRVQILSPGSILERY